jgi:hypothetical protein
MFAPAPFSGVLAAAGNSDVRCPAAGQTGNKLKSAAVFSEYGDGGYFRAAF